jgi:tetratricopeptide (TPR) repeat protein
VLSVKPDKWFLLGDYYKHKRRFAKALRCYGLSWRKESKNKGVLVSMAECCRGLDRPDRAKAYYEKALAFNAAVEGFAEDPYDAEIRKALAQLPAEPVKVPA